MTAATKKVVIVTVVGLAVDVVWSEGTCYQDLCLFFEMRLNPRVTRQ